VSTEGGKTFSQCFVWAKSEWCRERGTTFPSCEKKHLGLQLSETPASQGLWGRMAHRQGFGGKSKTGHLAAALREKETIARNINIASGKRRCRENE